MLLPSRKWSTLLFMLPLFAAACERPAPFKVADRTPHDDADAPFDPPNTYPGWAFDAPQYTKPTEELTPEPKVKPGDPLHYFTREKIVMIRQPSGYTPEEIPRIAIWSSDNNGFHWQKAGFFGRQQSYFPFEVKEDGDYGIRFVGPNQEQSVHATAYPERVYHVDTALPEVEVTIEPEQSWYNVGQSVTISWRADDYHLIELPVTITSLLDFTADESKPIEIQKGLAKEGSITYQIPPESLNHEMRFRVDALDRANNLGIAYSYALQVVSEPVDNSNAKPTEKDDLKEQVSMHGNVETSNPPEAVAVIPPPQPRAAVLHSTPVEKVVANPTPKKTPPTEEIIEEDASPNSAKPGKLPYATHLARQPERKSSMETSKSRNVETQQDVVAVNPQSSDENAAGDYRMDSSAEAVPAPRDFPEVSPTDAGAFMPIQPLDQSAESQGQAANPAGEPISMNHRLKTGATATGDCETDLTLLTLRDGAKDDLTHGNGLLIPMPATVEAKHSERQTAMAHPWRMLSQAVETPIKTVWALPQAEFMQRNPVLRGLFLAGAQMLRPLGEPAQSESHVAGLNSDAENPVPTP